MFKMDPKTMVTHTFTKLFGREHKPVITGVRTAHPVYGAKGGSYRVELSVDGTVLCAAENRDWRKAYKLLKIAVESLYADGTSLV